MTTPKSKDFKYTANSFMKILNDKGESGQSCFKPQFTVTNL